MNAKIKMVNNKNNNFFYNEIKKAVKVIIKPKEKQVEITKKTLKVMAVAMLFILISPIATIFSSLKRYK